jgi:hypothetical protein
VAQVIEHLLCKGKALSSNSRPTKKKKRKIFCISNHICYTFTNKTGNKGVSVVYDKEKVVMSPAS